MALLEVEERLLQVLCTKGVPNMDEALMNPNFKQKSCEGNGSIQQQSTRYLLLRVQGNVRDL